MTEPYYSDDWVQLHVGDWRELIPTDFRADLILTDPPYGETSLAWDRWPTGWPALAARHADRFKRVHEHALHWYRGPWQGVNHEAPRAGGARASKSIRSRGQSPHIGNVDSGSGYVDDGFRIVRSVLRAHSMQQQAINETEKPVQLLEPLLTYGCPPGGTVLDLFAGSCSTGVAAKHTGRRAVLYELREEQAELAARRLSQDVLDFGGGVA